MDPVEEVAGVVQVEVVAVAVQCAVVPVVAVEVADRRPTNSAYLIYCSVIRSP